MSKEHELKIRPEYFKAAKAGDKTCEVRKNDRGFKVGDTLRLREYQPCKFCDGSGTRWVAMDILADCECGKPHGSYTGDLIRVKVTHVLDESVAGVGHGYVVLSFRRLDYNG